MQAPGFWDDQEKASKLSAEHARASRKLASYRELESEIDDLDALEEMAVDDESIVDELEEQRSGVEAKLAALEEERLFAGPYDAGVLLLQLVSHRLVLGRQLLERLEVVELGLERAVGAQLARSPRVLRRHLRGPLLVVPEAGRLHLLLERLYALGECSWVKGSPRAA